MSSVRYTRFAAIAILIVGFAWTWLSRPVDTDLVDLRRPSTRIGAPAPMITLPTPENQSLNLSAYLGKPIVLNFWASWCPPCRAEMAALNQVQQDFSQSGVTVLGVNQLESEQTVIAFMRDQHLEFAIALDIDGSASRLYQVQALPTTYFIDKTGIIRDVIYGGPMTRALVTSKIQAMIDR